MGEGGEVGEVEAAGSEESGEAADAIDILVADEVPVGPVGGGVELAEADADEFVEFFEGFEPGADEIGRGGHVF